jgi:hypothetical protein
MPKFVFRNNQTIGMPAAEQDETFLHECFVDNGLFQIIRNCEDPRCILVGRTGAGKSALIAKLEEEEQHVVQIRPEALSLAYISGSNILKFVTETGVDLNLFYRLLWRHVFVVEILKERFGIEDEAKWKRFLDYIWTIVTRNKKHELALNYIKDWGETFWQETEYRIKEVTKKLEKDIESAVEESVPGLGKLSASAAKKLSEEQKAEVIHRAQEVVSKVQIRELSAIIEFLDEVLLSDRQQRFYITIDKLDDNWVEDTLRLRLIRALIETCMDFASIKNAKIIVALRSDLLDRVYRFTRDIGFQEEKFRAVNLDISWSRQELVSILDTRINFLVKEQYTNASVTFKDLLPKISRSKKQQPTTIDYILDRTLLRPRDIIQFFNNCIKTSYGYPTVPLKSLFEAEGAYSRERFRALGDEWYSIYPNLLHLASVLRGRPENFLVKDISLTELEENYLSLMVAENGREGDDYRLMDLTWNDKITKEEYRQSVVLIFYKVGLIGLRVDKGKPLSWAYTGDTSVSGAEIGEGTRIHIQKTFWRHLGVQVAGISGDLPT